MPLGDQRLDEMGELPRVSAPAVDQEDRIALAPGPADDRTVGRAQLEPLGAGQKVSLFRASAIAPRFLLEVGFEYGD